LWILTGDKQETAISIGRACNVITDDMKVVKINTKSRRGAKRILEKQLEIVEYNQQVGFCV
jgi:magnesium-transporting ATPase (P-type)